MFEMYFIFWSSMIIFIIIPFGVIIIIIIIFTSAAEVWSLFYSRDKKYPSNYMIIILLTHT